VHLDQFKEPSAIVARWLEFLSQFCYRVEYRKGTAHGNADGLSRQRQSVPVVKIGMVDIPQPFVQRCNWSMREWAQAQQQDEDVSQLRDWLRLRPPQELPDLTGASQELRHYWRGRQFLCEKEEVICKRSYDAKTPDEIMILVPKAMRPMILKEYHDELGHVGTKRTTSQIQKRFFWHGLSRDVEDWIGSCESCSRRSRPIGRGVGAPLQVTWSGYPLERIAMDLIPGLPETANGNRHILVIVDYFTKWVEAYPLRKMDAGTIASVFVSEFVARFGAPEKVHTDQGKNFDSKLFKDVCSLLGIGKTRTTAYHPSGNGLVERFNQTLERMLSHYVAANQRDWDVNLPAMLMAYRATPQASTGYSPFYLLFGREMCLPQDVAYGLPPQEEVKSNPPSYVWDLRQKLAKAHSEVREKLRSVHQHDAHLHDERAVAVSFDPGDLVWLLVPAIPVGTTAKLAKLWQGPFEVVARLTEVVYRVSDTRSDVPRLQVVHVNRLKRYRGRPGRLQVDRQGLPSTGSSGLAGESVTEPGYAPDSTDQLYEHGEQHQEHYLGEDIFQVPLPAALPPPLLALPDPAASQPPTMPLALSSTSQPSVPTALPSATEGPSAATRTRYGRVVNPPSYYGRPGT